MVEFPSWADTPEKRLRSALIDVSNLMGLPNNRILKTPEDLQSLPEKEFLGVLPINFYTTVVYDPDTEEPRLPQPTEAERTTRAEEVIFSLRDTLFNNRDFYHHYWMIKRSTESFERDWEERQKGKKS